MKRFFSFLLFIGIILTIGSAFLLNNNGVYAIFMATLGVMITTFSVFEIVGLKKIKKNTGPIASQIKTKKNDGIEWTYYDIGEKPENQSKQILEEKPKIEFTLGSRILSLFKIKKHSKIKGEKIEEENKKEITKLSKNKDKEKLIKLREYISESLKNKIPKDKIIEACLASDWPREKIDEAMRDFNKKHTSKDIKILYFLIPLTTLLFFALLLTDNFLIILWFQSIKNSSAIAYYALLFLVAMIFIAVIFDFKEQLTKKRKVYKIKRDKIVTDIKTEMATKKESSTDSGFSYKTDIDKLLDLVNEKEKISVNEIGSIFNISKEEAEQWGKILKEQGLINLYYPTVGEVELRRKKREITEEEV